ncbi:MAG: hypothetical protein GY869_25180 [Planctomycetes bacterium]|nr:hypothetical protein [Planctomycetota bacterium]
MTADKDHKDRENTIGFEGSGLTSDKYVRVASQWFDHDGSPLPEELPGFTGRLAKVVAANALASVSSDLANFEIKPGHNTEFKEYADGAKVIYTYDAAGRLSTRTWARQNIGQPLTTTYNYDSSTGDLIEIDYSDSTPDITFAYNRLGQQKGISDAVGARNFTYNNNLQLETEIIVGLYDQTITHTYDTTDAPGRSSGFTLGPDYTVSLGYEEATGRFNNVGWEAKGKSDTVTYSYFSNSDLLRQSTTDNDFKTTYTYEPHRNLRTRVHNYFNNQTVSRYDYVYDEMGRRTSVANIGKAFAPAAFRRYGYNDRSELIKADSYLGTDITDFSNWSYDISILL